MVWNINWTHAPAPVSGIILTPDPLWFHEKMLNSGSDSSPAPDVDHLWQTRIMYSTNSFARKKYRSTTI